MIFNIGFIINVRFIKTCFSSEKFEKVELSGFCIEPINCRVAENVLYCRSPSKKLNKIICGFFSFLRILENKIPKIVRSRKKTCLSDTETRHRLRHFIGFSGFPINLFFTSQQFSFSYNPCGFTVLLRKIPTKFFHVKFSNFKVDE